MRSAELLRKDRANIRTFSSNECAAWILSYKNVRPSSG
jgi:hypothetical protein